MNKIILIAIGFSVSLFAQSSGIGSGGGVQVLTASYTTQVSDAGSLIYMNCSSTCTLTLLGTPNYGYKVSVESVGSTLATISLNGLNFNGLSSAPIPISYRPITFASDGNNYFGDSPFMLGANMSVTPVSNAVTLAAFLGKCQNAASPAVCGSAVAGSVAIPTGVTTSTLQVNTTAVTANSLIFLFPDDTVATPLGISACNSTLATLVGGMAITARTPGTSFTVTFNGTIATNPLCIGFLLVN